MTELTSHHALILQHLVYDSLFDIRGIESVFVLGVRVIQTWHGLQNLEMQTFVLCAEYEHVFPGEPVQHSRYSLFMFCFNVSEP